MFVLFYAHLDGDGYLVHQFLGITDSYEKAKSLIVQSKHYNPQCCNKIVTDRQYSRVEYTDYSNHNHYVIESITLNTLSELEPRLIDFPL